MKKVYKKILKVTLSLLVGLAIASLLLVWWLYNGSIIPLKNKVFESIPFPVALANGRFIPMRDFILRYNVAIELGGAQATALSGEQLKQQAYNQLIADNETQALAAQNNVSLSQDQIDQGYQTTAQNADLQGYPNFDALLASYGLSRADFENQILKPQLLTTALEIWFNSQPSLNQKEYSLADSLLQKIQSGQDMGQLAVEYTQDPTGQSVQGDLGFVQVSSLLPELQEAVGSMEVGDVKIIPSRYGLHIIRVEQKTGDLDQLREIFLDTESYNNWFLNQTENFKIKKLLNI